MFNLKSFLLIILLSVSSVFALQGKPDGWNSSFYFVKPSSEKWLLANPSFCASNDSFPYLYTTFIGPFAYGHSISGLEAGWPLKYNFYMGFVVSGTGNFFARSTIDANNGGVSLYENSVFVNGLYAVAISYKPFASFKIGALGLLYSREYDYETKRLPGILIGASYNYYDIFNVGLSAGHLSGSDDKTYPSEDFVDYQLGLRLLKNRIVFGNSGKFNSYDNKIKMMYVTKLWVFKTTAIRVGHNPSGFNFGAAIKYTASGRPGIIEYYIGKGYFHNIHIFVSFK